MSTGWPEEARLKIPMMFPIKPSLKKIPTGEWRIRELVIQPSWAKVYLSPNISSWGSAKTFSEKVQIPWSYQGSSEMMMLNTGMFLIMLMTSQILSGVSMIKAARAGGAKESKTVMEKRRVSARTETFFRKEVMWLYNKIL